MTLFRVYIATSLDGYITTPDGGVGWLKAFPKEEFDFAGFFKGVAVVVMGRTTFDHVMARGQWRDTGKRTVVLTHREIENPPVGVETYGGDVRELAVRLRGEITNHAGDNEAAGRDVGLIGGAKSIRAFHEAGLVDRWQIFVAPVLLGGGISLFSRRYGSLERMRLTYLKKYQQTDFVEVWYEPQR